MTDYIIFGDSIAFGEGDPNGGWVKKLSQQNSVNNLSIDGATTNTFIKNFPNNLNSELTLVVALGVNDSIFLPLTRFKQNLIQLIKLGRKLSNKIIFVGPAPADQSKVDPIPWESNHSYLNKQIELYSQTIDKICSKYKLKFIDLFHHLPPEYINTLEDGVHPNSNGHKMIFDIIINNL